MGLSERSIVWRAALAVTLVAALSLTACGRRGPLQPPPSADTAGTTAAGKPAATTAATTPKPFILDPLL